MEEILRKFHLTDKECSIQISDQHILDISASYCEKWRDLQVPLQMKPITVTDVERDHFKENERRKAFFKVWKKEKGSKATYKVLLSSLLKLKRRSDAEGICGLLQKVVSEMKLQDVEECAEAKPAIADLAKADKKKSTFSCFDDKQLSDVSLDLMQQLNTNYERIVNKYAHYVSAIRDSLCAQNSSVSALRGFLGNLPAFTYNRDENKLKLLSGQAIDFDKAASIDDIFDILSKQCCNFLHYGIFQSIVDKYKIDDEEVLKYPEYLENYLNEHKVAEFISINPELLKEVKDSSEKCILKFDIEIALKLSTLEEFRITVAKILKVRASTLKFLSIDEGCVIVTYFIPAPVAKAIFTGPNIFDLCQIKQFQGIKALWLKYEDYQYNFETDAASFKNDNSSDPTENEDKVSVDDSDNFSEPPKELELVFTQSDSSGNLSTDVHTPQVAIKGLDLFCGDKNCIRKSYDYVPLQMGEVPLQPTVVKSHENIEKLKKNNPFIYLHDLELQDKFPDMPEEKMISMTGVILINTLENYKVSEDIACSFKEIFNSIPICLVKKTDGQEILSLENNKVFMIQRKVESPADKDKPKVEKQHSDLRLKLVSIKNSQKAMAMSGTTFSIISECGQCLDQDENDFGDCIKFLLEIMSRFIHDDFPFYILLADLIIKRSKQLDYNSFIQHFLFLMEKMDSAIISQRFNRQDFEGEQEVLLAKACLVLANYSGKVKIRMIEDPVISGRGTHRSISRIKSFPANFVYSKIMWISLSLKFYETPINKAKSWDDNLFRHCHEIGFNSDTIKEIVRGLELGQKLQLRDNDKLSTYFEMWIIGEDMIRPFSDLQRYLVAMHNFESGGESIINACQILLKQYKNFFQTPGREKFQKLSKKGDQKQCIVEGLQFLECVNSIALSHSELRSIDSLLEDWLRLLIQLVDIETGNVPSCLFYMNCSFEMSISKIIVEEVPR